MKKYGKYILAYASSFVIFLMGIVLRSYFKNDVIATVLLILALLPILLLIVNVIFSKLYIKKINQTTIADMHEYMLGHRNDAEKTSITLLKKLQKIRRATTVYAVFLCVFAASAALLGGMFYDEVNSLTYLSVLYGGTVFFAVFARIKKREPFELDESMLVLEPKDYPHIYSIASRAAKKLDCRKNITIFLSLDCNAGVFNTNTGYYIQLGIVLLNLLSEEELYCIFLHEFSHCSDKNKPHDREMAYSSWIPAYKQTNRLLYFISRIFSAFDNFYMFNHLTYHYATSVVREIEADLDCAKYGDPKVAASALTKTNYYEKYLWEKGVKDESAEFLSESPNPHYLSEQIDDFKGVAKERQQDWNAMLEKEILANNASHPTLKMRLKTIGIEKIELIEDNSSITYQNETQAALAFADKKLSQDQSNYENYRKECYLEPLHRITEWEEKGMPLSAENYADIISDLKQLGRHEDAERLCDRAINELDKNSALHACFMKGCAMIHRYDKAGVDLIFHALENNSNYLEEGLCAIGAFYCMTGMEKELIEYRLRGQQLMQKDKDEYSQILFLSKNDNLSRDTMPQDMLDDILAFIRSVDEDIIQNVYLVRKTVTDTFFTSAFVIHFYGGTDAQRGEIMHKIFCYLDAYPTEWQFSLFDYFECPNIKFNKIEGSLVYTKPNDKGDQQ